MNIIYPILRKRVVMRRHCAADVRRSPRYKKCTELLSKGSHYLIGCDVIKARIHPSAISQQPAATRPPSGPLRGRLWTRMPQQWGQLV